MGRVTRFERANDRFTAGCVSLFTTLARALIIININEAFVKQILQV